MRKSNEFIPANNEELFNHYFAGPDSLALNTIRKMMPHSTQDERETLLNDAYVRFVEHKVREKYDASKSNFGGMIYVVVRTVVSHYLSKKKRNPLTGLYGGSLQATTEQFERRVYALDRMIPTEKSPDEEGVKDLRLDFILSYVNAVAENPSCKRDESLKTVVEMLRDGYEPSDIAEKCGVASSTVHGWCYYMRELATSM